MRIALFLAALSAAAASAATCESLAGLKLPDTTITVAQEVAAAANTPAYCRVAATLKPSTDSDIKIEVWLPTTTWHEKFVANGNGGWSGSITPQTLAAAVRRGYATAMTDTGHQGGSGSFALGHPEKLTDFAYRAVHEMTVKSKAVIAAYYGKPAKLSYWNGCSSGGKQGLKEAQRFPDDFDGIVAGAPANYWTHLTAQSVWTVEAAKADPAGDIPAAKAQAIHKAVLAACDALDGVKDNLIENPTRCHFDPQSLLCKAADAPDCLTALQVETAKKVLGGPMNPRTKQQIFPGFEPGSEQGWPQTFQMAGGLGGDHFKYVVFKDANWDLKSLNYDSDIAQADRIDDGQINATDPNLAPFFKHGGKLLMYHGWADPLIPSQNSIDYVKSVQGKLGNVDDSLRLFMAPGVGHCAGGDGPSTFDMLGALEQWVEQKHAPESILASHSSAGAVDRTRPLCAYPNQAVYKGSGSIDDAQNFDCKVR
ncbi:MAG TPA: tannase/feruloyl esterase family alpha/beta hydrolase [Bryobacteraceae bacterium]|jgi:feruloyl esterase